MRNRPALLTVLTFLGLIAVGAVLLHALGFEGRPGQPFLSSAFTATSAVCVTGLNVLDVSRDLSPTGQALTLLLIQLGGLGVLTLSNVLLLALRDRLGVGGALFTSETYGQHPTLEPRRVLGNVVAFTFATEAVGTAILFLRFAADMPPLEALWQAGYHAVSAFCNAGFSLFSTSLVPYAGDPVVNLTVVGLIVSGGIGFVVAADLAVWVRGRRGPARPRLAYHSRVVLATTATLVVGGGLLVLAFEWGNALAGRPLGERLLSSLFLSVTSRTAGFNTLDTGHLTNMTLLAVVILMGIGASPGSCGGGVKTTTMAIIGARVRSHVLNRSDTELLGRSVPREIAAKAMAILMLYLLVVLLALVALQATEFGEVPHDQTRGLFLGHLFEVVSALSTVGLSTGVTPGLTDAGRVVIMLCMFVGRVGPLVLAVSFVGERQRLAYAHPTGDVMVG